MANPLPKKSITVADVEKTNNFTALTIMVQELRLEVPLDKQNVTGFKMVLMEHLMKKGGSEIVKQPKKWDTTSAASSEDLSNRFRLNDFYKHTINYVEKLPGPFQNLFDNYLDDLNEFFPGYKQQLQTYSEELKTSKCVLLVAGETGSGKSSLVNLLLGVSLMPTSELQCTTAIVEIQYGPQPYAEMHYRDDSSGKSRHPIKEKATAKDQVDNLIKTLQHHITLRDPETDESPYEKIQVYWPLEMLKAGATIVDSPGVGGHRALPQQLADYMERAFGFIYVVDSAGSIHKHRLGQLLLKATEKDNDAFDQDTAIFVCNRWDLVKSDEAPRVLRAMTDRLSMILPGIKQSQLFPISVRESKASIKYGQVTKEHQQLIEGIRNFLPQTMRAKLRIYYRYLSGLLKRSLYSLRLSYLNTKNLVVQMEGEVVKRDKRRQMLDKSAQVKLDDMRTEVRAATIHASERLLQHLNSMHVHSRMSSWTNMPKKERWQNVLKNVNVMISERLAFEINEWEKSSKIVEKVGKDIVGKFQKQFQLFNDEVAKVEESLFLTEESQVPHAMMDFNQAMQRNSKQAKMLKAAARGKDSGFLSLGAAIVSNLNLDQRDSEVRRIFRDNFDKDPRYGMKMATELFVGLLTEANAISCIGKFFDRFVKGIDRVGKLVPQLIKADQALLQNINKEVTDKEAKLRMFPKLSKDCSSIQGELDMLYLQRLMVMDFTADKFNYTDKDKLGKGSFATVYKTKIGSKTVALKEPKEKITKNDVTDILLEEQMLRTTTHRNIVSYHGAYRKGAADSLFLNLVMEYCPFTVKDRYINSSSSPSNHGDNPIRQTEAIGMMTNFLIQICDGLNYLHDKNIVHRDLKPENLLLTEDNVIKIADLGLAKSIHQIVTVGIGTPVYMAPEILLLFETYDTKADIYSFGMIIWELWYGQDLAHYATMELTGGLKVNIENKWRPKLTIPAAPTPFWEHLINKCWHQDPSKRPSAKEIGLKLIEVYKQVEEFKKKHSKG